MQAPAGLAGLVHAIHARLVWILLATYIIAALAPGPGLALRSWSAGTVNLAHASLNLTGPTLLLALLLFNASLCVNTAQLRTLASTPRVLVGGVLANAAVPLIFTAIAAGALSFWDDHHELQMLLVGLAVVGSMPIAGSSTAWAQNGEGNLALSLGLVLTSTLISPLMTPVGFHAVAHLTSGDYAEDLRELAGLGTQLFLFVAVIAPSAGGMVLHRALGGGRVKRALPGIKLANIVCLLLLNYANAAVALPQVVAEPDFAYLGLIGTTVAALCAIAFLAGRLVGQLLHAHEPEKVSLMFALGMNNNGSGLVLASASLADHPGVLLVIVAYNLVQQLAAGFADRWLLRRRGAAGLVLT